MICMARKIMREARAKPIAASRVVEDQGRQWTYVNSLNMMDQFWMPEVHAALLCDYGELIGRTYLHENQGTDKEGWWEIQEAQQLINVQMNHKGALVEAVFKIPPDFLSISASDSKNLSKAAPPPLFPKRLQFDGPFMMSLWREGADLPYLVCWVDSADVLRRP